MIEKRGKFYHRVTGKFRERLNKKSLLAPREVRQVVNRSRVSLWRYREAGLIKHAVETKTQLLYTLESALKLKKFLNKIPEKIGAKKSRKHSA